MRLLLVGETTPEYKLALLTQGRGHTVTLDRVEHWTWVEGERDAVVRFIDEYKKLRDDWLSGNYQIPDDESLV